MCRYCCRARSLSYDAPCNHLVPLPLGAPRNSAVHGQLLGWRHHMLLRACLSTQTLSHRLLVQIMARRPHLRSCADEIMPPHARRSRHACPQRHGAVEPKLETPGKQLRVLIPPALVYASGDDRETQRWPPSWPWQARAQCRPQEPLQAGLAHRARPTQGVLQGTAGHNDSRPPTMLSK